MIQLKREFISDYKMTLIKSIALMILTLWSTSLKSQFTLDELKQIRIDQIRLVACDSLLNNCESRSNIKSLQIEKLSKSIRLYAIKDSTCQDERHYYLDQIRDRNETITKLEMKSKRNKIIAIGASTLVIILLVLSL